MQPLSLEPIRHAVSSGDFGRAQLLWDQCAAGLAEELSNRCLTEARLREVGDLVEWSRNVVLCERAHWQKQLNSLYVSAEYELPVPRRAHRLVLASF